MTFSNINIFWITCVTLAIIFMIETSTRAQKFDKEDKEKLKNIGQMMISRQDLSDGNMRRDNSDEKIEKFNRAIEKIMMFINALGQLDTFINEKAKIFVKRLNAMYSVDDDF